SSTSMMSMNGTMFRLSKGLSSMSDLPAQQQHFRPTLENVVQRDGHECHGQTHCGSLQCKRQPDHNLQGVDALLNAHLIERVHDAQYGAKQAYIGRIGRDQRKDADAMRQQQLERLAIRHGAQVDVPIARDALDSDGHDGDAQYDEQADHTIVDETTD